MHDTVLLGKISQELERLCRENNIVRLLKLVVEVSGNSHVNHDNLKEYLREYNLPLVGEWTTVIVNKEAIEEQSAYIHSLEGETREN